MAHKKSTRWRLDEEERQSDRKEDEGDEKENDKKPNKKKWTPEEILRWRNAVKAREEAVKKKKRMKKRKVEGASGTLELDEEMQEAMRILQETAYLSDDDEDTGPPVPEPPREIIFVDLTENDPLDVKEEPIETEEWEEEKPAAVVHLLYCPVCDWGTESAADLDRHVAGHLAGTAVSGASAADEQAAVLTSEIKVEKNNEELTSSPSASGRNIFHTGAGDSSAIPGALSSDTINLPSAKPLRDTSAGMPNGSSSSSAVIEEEEEVCVVGERRRSTDIIIIDENDDDNNDDIQILDPSNSGGDDGSFIMIDKVYSLAPEATAGPSSAPDVVHEKTRGSGTSDAGGPRICCRCIWCGLFCPDGPKPHLVVSEECRKRVADMLRWMEYTPECVTCGKSLNGVLAHRLHYRERVHCQNRFVRLIHAMTCRGGCWRCQAEERERESGAQSLNPRPRDTGRLTSVTDGAFAEKHEATPLATATSPASGPAVVSSAEATVTLSPASAVPAAPVALQDSQANPAMTSPTSNNSSFPCILCRITFQSAEIRVQHLTESPACLEVHLSLSPWAVACFVCAHLFNDDKGFVNHLYGNSKCLNLHMDSPSEVACPICLRPFDSMLACRVHVLWTRCAQSFPCCGCSKTFSCTKERRTHVLDSSACRLKHIMMPCQTEWCQKCEKSFLTMLDLKRHVCSGVKERPPLPVPNRRSDKDVVGASGSKTCIPSGISSTVPHATPVTSSSTSAVTSPTASGNSSKPIPAFSFVVPTSNGPAKVALAPLANLPNAHSTPVTTTASSMSVAVTSSTATPTVLASPLSRAATATSTATHTVTANTYSRASFGVTANHAAPATVRTAVVTPTAATTAMRRSPRIAVTGTSHHSAQRASIEATTNIAPASHPPNPSTAPPNPPTAPYQAAKVPVIPSTCNNPPSYYSIYPSMLTSANSTPNTPLPHFSTTFTTATNASATATSFTNSRYAEPPAPPNVNPFTSAAPHANTTPVPAHSAGTHSYTASTMTKLGVNAPAALSNATTMGGNNASVANTVGRPRGRAYMPAANPAVPAANPAVPTANPTVPAANPAVPTAGGASATLPNAYPAVPSGSGMGAAAAGGNAAASSGSSSSFDKEVHCILCHRNLPSHNELLQHLMEFIPCRAVFLARSQCSFHCGACKHLFPSLVDRRKHLESEELHRSLHETISVAEVLQVRQWGQQILYCKQCCSAFNYPGDFHCSGCSSSFHSMNALREHWYASASCQKNLAVFNPNPIKLDMEVRQAEEQGKAVL